MEDKKFINKVKNKDEFPTIDWKINGMFHTHLKN